MNSAILSRRALIGWGAAALAGGLLTACGSTPGTPVAVGSSNGPLPTGELRADAPRLAAAPAPAAGTTLSAFAATLFRAATPGNGNAVMSPYSVAAALGMAGLGADGPGLKAFTAVLGADPATIAAQITAVDAAVAAALTASEADIESRNDERPGPMVVQPANSLFVDRTTKVLPTFLTDVAAGYDAGVFTVDFVGATEAARGQINEWVSEKTNSLIPQILGPGVVTPDWRVALVNALYLKASWEKDFGRQDGKLRFTTAAGKTVAADELFGGRRTLPLASGDGWTAVTVPYTGGKLAMTFLLPDKGKFDALAESLDGATLVAAASGTETLVNVTLPAFRTDFPVDLTEPLKALGFGPFYDSPLTKLSTEPDPLFAQAVIHQARIGVDEHGTEAAAATVVAAVAGAAPGPETKPTEFVADRPFIYTIHDTATKVPLFLGRVVDPTQE